MRKLFLFTAAVLAMGSSQVKATDHIVNGGFESTDAPTLLSTGAYKVNQPAGWTLNYTTTLLNSASNWDQAIITQGKKDNGNTDLGVAIPEGSNFFFARMRWEAGTVMSLSQTHNLAAGDYLLSFSAFGPEAATYPTKLAIVVGTDTVSKLDLKATTWTKFKAAFTLTAAADVKVVFDLKHTSTASQQTFYLDNVVLSDDPAAIFSEDLRTLCQTISTLTWDGYPKGYEQKLTDMVANVNDNVLDQGVDLATLKAAYADLDAVYQEFLASATSYKTLNDLDLQTDALKLLAYPGLDAFSAAESATWDVLDGANSLKADFDKAIIDFTAAIRTYRLSQSTLATKTDPVDFTFLINAPTFTKDGGNVATAADRVQGTWVNGNNVTSSSSIDVRLNTVTGYNCWNSWADAWQGTMDLYQKLTNLPVGLYTVSAKHVSNGNASTTTHVYATTVAGTKSSPICNNIYEGTGTFATDAQWVTYQTDTILVASDGALRIGITSTGEGTKAGWFCVTDFKLNYYGAQAVLDEYKKSLAAKIEIAKTAAAKEMLVSETAAINSAITTAQTADASSAAAIEATMATLNVAVAKADTAALAMTSFKTGSYATLVAQATDASKSPGLEAFVNVQVDAVDAALTAVDATTDVYTSFGKKLAIAVSYGKAQIAATVAAGLNEDVANLLLDTQDHYDALSLTADTTALKTYTTELTAYSTFAALYITNIALATDATYSADAQTAFKNTMQTIIASIKSASDLSTATTNLQAAVGALKSTGVQPGDDLTAKWIVNAETTATGNSVAMTGWSITKTNGNTFSATGQHWSADTSRRYLDSWNATAGLLQYTATQSIKGLSNGTYKMKCAARSSGAGAVFYALTGADTIKVEIPNNVDTAGGIWADSEDGSAEKSAHGGVGYGWNWVTIDNINVGANELVFGVTTKSDFIHSTWTGTWFSASDFKLFYVSADYTQTGGVSIDEVSSDASTALNAYAENGYIVVPGATSFEVTTIAGATVNAKAQLAPGIYVVKAAGKVAKVVVK